MDERELDEDAISEMTCNFVSAADSLHEVMDEEIIYALLQTACIIAKRHEVYGEEGWLDMVSEGMDECLLMVESLEIDHPDLVKDYH